MNSLSNLVVALSLDTLAFGGQIVVIGMATIFAVLTLLMFALKLFELIFRRSIPRDKEGLIHTVGIMLLFGLNFNLYYLIIIGKIGSALKSSELWTYFGIFVCAVTLICFNVYELYGEFSEVLRVSVFQVSSIMTTTGFATTDFALWPALSKTILIILMIIGACAGSTAGGFKVSRTIILFKKIINDLRKVIHPRTATVVKFEGRRLDEGTINGVTTYTTIYFIITLAVFLLLSFDIGIPKEYAIETNLSATLACFNNIGPGLSLVGPTMSYSVYSPFSKILLSLSMLLGRLEIYPILIALNITTWLKK